MGEFVDPDQKVQTSPQINYICKTNGRNIMLDLLFNDPVAWGSLLGLSVVVALCGYYVYLIMHNTNSNL